MPLYKTIDTLKAIQGGINIGNSLLDTLGKLDKLGVFGRPIPEENNLSFTELANFYNKFKPSKTSPLSTGYGQPINLPTEEGSVYFPKQGDTFPGGFFKLREQLKQPQKPFIIDGKAFGYDAFGNVDFNKLLYEGEKPVRKDEYININIPGTDRMGRYNFTKKEFEKDSEGNYLFTDEPTIPKEEKRVEEPYIGNLMNRITVSLGLYKKISNSLKDKSLDEAEKKEKLKKKDIAELQLQGDTDELIEILGVTNDVNVMWEAIEEGVSVEDAISDINKTRLRSQQPPLTPKQKQGIKTYFKARKF